MSKVGRFQVGVMAIIEHPDLEKVLLVKRSPNKDYLPGTWETPGGRLDQFESHIDGLKREIKEETGIDIKVIKPIKIFHIFRGEKTAKNELIGIEFLCKALSKEVILSEEHTEYKWVDKNSLLDFINHEGVKESIRAYLEQ